MEIEKRLPFIAAIISSLIAWLATLLFLDQYIGLMTIALIVALLFFRFEPWAFIGSFLIGLAIDLFNSGAVAQLNVVIVMLLVGTILQITVYLLYKPSKATHLHSSVTQNMVFALIGMILSRVTQFVTCPPGYPVDGKTDILQTFFAVMDCHSRRFLEVLSQASLEHGSGIAYWNTVAWVFLRAFLLSPVLWTPAFAALRQVRFNVLQPGRVVKKTLTGLIGMALTGFFTWIIMLLLLPLVWTISHPSVALISQEDALKIVFILLLSIDAFFSILGAGWGASWGSN